MQTRQQKEVIVKDLTDKFKNSKAVIFSDFKGLSVKDMTQLRRELREKKIDIKVTKKTLIDIALKNAKIEAKTLGIEGQIAVAISSEDEVAAAKIISAFSKNSENIKIVGGVLGDKSLTKEEAIALSKLLSKEELLAKFVGSIKSPVSGFVNVFSGNLRNLVQVLKAVADSK